MKSTLLILALSIGSAFAQLNISNPFYNLGMLSPAGIFGPWFSAGENIGNLSSTYPECSGIASGKRSENTGYIWAIEDGPTGYVLAYDKTNATLCGKWTITGASTSDVEDVDSAVVGSQPYVYLADSGDNTSVRTSFLVIRIKEPVITRSDGTVGSPDVESIAVEYPSGNLPSHKDCEALLVDPANGDMYFVTKRISPVKMYRLTHAASYSGLQTLTYIGDLTADAAFNTLSTTVTGNNGYVTGGNISPDGKEILLRSYSTVWRFPRNPSTETIFQALSVAPVAMEFVGGGNRFLQPNSEPQGEAVCFDFSGTFYYSASELVVARGGSASFYPLFKYARLYSAPTTYTFQEGSNAYAGTIDTYLFQSVPGTANGSAVSMVVDQDYGTYPTITDQRQSLLRFDVSSIPSSSVVVSCTLDLYINTEGKGFTLWKMLQTWSESSTWTSMSAGVSFDGIECSSTADAIIFDATAGEGIDTYVGSYHINIPIATAQAWVSNSATNFGWCITGPDESSGDGLQLDTREGVTQSRRPRLTIKTQP